MPHILSFCVSHPYKPIIFIFPPKPWAVCADWQATQSSTPGHINIHWSWLDLPGAIKQMALREKIPTFPRISLFKRWSINMRMWIDITLIGASRFVCLFVCSKSFILSHAKKEKRFTQSCHFCFFFLGSHSYRYTDMGYGQPTLPWSKSWILAKREKCGEFVHYWISFLLVNWWIGYRVKKMSMFREILKLRNAIEHRKICVSHLRMSTLTKTRNGLRGN